MLSNEERQELLALAHSPSIRQEFRQLRTASPTAVSVDTLVVFLTTMSRILPAQPHRRSPAPYLHAKL